MVKIRFQRIGRKNRPFYRIGAFDGRTKQSGKFLELLGTYNPIETESAKVLNVKKERVEHWLSEGAQLSDAVKSVLKKHSVLNAD